MSRKLNILCIKFKINSVHDIHSVIYDRGGILLTVGKHLRDCIISLRGEAWGHKTSLNRINMSQKSGYQIQYLPPSMFLELLYIYCQMFS